MNCSALAFVANSVERKHWRLRNVFSIPAGAAFLGAFTRALLDGEIIPGLSRESGPLALAETTIYVPTRRAARALAAQLSAAIEAPAALLPRILPLGDLDEQEASALFHADARGGRRSTTLWRRRSRRSTGG